MADEGRVGNMGVREVAAPDFGLKPQKMTAPSGREPVERLRRQIDQAKALGCADGHAYGEMEQGAGVIVLDGDASLGLLP